MVLLASAVVAQASPAADGGATGHASKRQGHKAVTRGGVVKSFTDGQLTIDRTRGRDLTGSVTAATKVRCRTADGTSRRSTRSRKRRRGRGRNRSARAVRAAQLELDDDLGDDPGDGDDAGDDDPAGDPGDDDPLDDLEDLGDTLLGDDGADEDDPSDGDGDGGGADPQGRPQPAAGCTTASLTPGARVRTAKTRRSAGRTVFTRVTLARAR